MNTSMTNFLLSAGKKYGQPVSVLCRATTPMAIIYMTILWPPTHGHSMTKLDTHPENLRPFYNQIILYCNIVGLLFLFCYYFIYYTTLIVHQSTASIYHLIPSTAISMIFFSSPSYQCQYQHQLPTTATIYPLFVTPKYITAAESAFLLAIKQNTYWEHS